MSKKFKNCVVVSFTLQSLVAGAYAAPEPLPESWRNEGWEDIKQSSGGIKTKAGKAINGPNRIVQAPNSLGIRGEFTEPEIGPVPFPYNTDKPTFYYGFETSDKVVKGDTGIQWEAQINKPGQPGYVPAGWRPFLNMVNIRQGKYKRRLQAKPAGGVPIRILRGQLEVVSMSLNVRKDGLVDLKLNRSPDFVGPTVPLPANTEIVGKNPHWPRSTKGINFSQIKMRRVVGITQGNNNRPGGIVPHGQYMRWCIFKEGQLATTHPRKESDWKPWYTGGGLNTFNPEGNSRKTPHANVGNSVWPWVMDFQPRRHPTTGYHNTQDSTRYRQEIVHVNMLNKGQFDRKKSVTASKKDKR